MNGRTGQLAYACVLVLVSTVLVVIGAAQPAAAATCGTGHVPSDSTATVVHSTRAKHALGVRTPAPSGRAPLLRSCSDVRQLVRTR
jgi:hypothetical protein